MRSLQGAIDVPHIRIFKKCLTALAVFTAVALAASQAHADGCFVFKWNKAKDINDPTQKAILLYDQGKEDLVLQVKYEGPAEDFGWLIPVPALPQVRKGSMDCFYELSRLTQERFGDGRTANASTLGRREGPPEAVKVIEIKTVGAFEIAVLSTSDSHALTEWLQAHNFVFPNDKQEVLDGYIRKNWYFVAAKVNPEQNGFTLKSELPKKPTITRETRKKLAQGELHPLVLSFKSEKCVFPLAISSVNGKPSEISLYVLSAEPLASPVIFEKDFAKYRQERARWLAGLSQREKERNDAAQRLTQISRQTRSRLRDDYDPADAEPDVQTRLDFVRSMRPSRPSGYEPEEYYGGRDLIRSLELSAKSIPASARELPRLAGKTWWLTKQVSTFTPHEMRDLEFEPAVPLLRVNLRTADGAGPAFSLARFGPRALPVLLDALKSSESTDRMMSLAALREFGYASQISWPNGSPTQTTKPVTDPRLVDALQKLLADPDPRIRARACSAAAANWHQDFVSKITELLQDDAPEVRSSAGFALDIHSQDFRTETPAFRKMVEEDSPGAGFVLRFLLQDRDSFSRPELLRLLSSTNFPVVSQAYGALWNQGFAPDELTPLLTNASPIARRMALLELTQMADARSVDLIVSVLHDPDENVRWYARYCLRKLSGQKLGSDPLAWEQWWANHKETYTPREDAISGRGLAGRR